jgi:hypothetical protein
MNYKYSIIIGISILSGLTLTALGYTIFKPKKSTFKDLIQERVEESPKEIIEEKINEDEILSAR